MMRSVRELAEHIGNVRVRGFFGDVHSGWMLLGTSVSLVSVVLALLIRIREVVVVAMILCFVAVALFILDGILVARIDSRRRERGGAPGSSNSSDTFDR